MAFERQYGGSDVRNIVSIDTVCSAQINFHNDFVFIARSHHRQLPVNFAPHRAFTHSPVTVKLTDFSVFVPYLPLSGHHWPTVLAPVWSRGLVDQLITF